MSEALLLYPICLDMSRLFYGLSLIITKSFTGIYGKMLSTRKSSPAGSLSPFKRNLVVLRRPEEALPATEQEMRPVPASGNRSPCKKGPPSLRALWRQSISEWVTSAHTEWDRARPPEGPG